ncbi:MAG: NHL repeat-containing protein [Thermoanaerobaculia bacterium]
MRQARPRLPIPLLLPLLLAVLAPGCLMAAVPKYQDLLTLPVLGDRIVSAVAVTVDEATGEIFVCDDRGNRILIFDREGLFSFEIPGGENFSAPKDLAVDRDGFLFLLTARSGSRGRILLLDFDGLPIDEIQLADLPPQLPVPSLESVAISPDGARLAALDGRNNRLWITDRSGRIETSVDLTSDLSDSELEDLFPSKVDIYGDKLLVAMTSLAQIWCFELDGTPCGRVGKSGGGACGLLFPNAAALEASGNYLMIDQQRMVVLRWNPNTEECIGEYSGPGDAPGYLYYPFDIFLDSTGQLFVAQSYQGKVQVYSGLSPAHSVPAAD